MSNDGIKLEAHDLNLWYGENHALKGINISLPDKMITALIGPSGCGKSTFLRSLNRMNDLVEGCRRAVQIFTRIWTLISFASG